MIKRQRIRKEIFLLNMILFIGFSFEFFIRDDRFSGIILIFNGIINLLAFQQAPRKVALLTIILNLFNVLIGMTVAYNYSMIDYLILYLVWVALTLFYIVLTLVQTYNFISSRQSKRKQKRKYN